MPDASPGSNDLNVLFSELLAMPLAAIVHSDSMAAHSLAKFILEFGFEPAPDGAEPGELGPLRMVSFTYQSTDRDGGEIQRQLSVPLLSLVPLPALTIREATIDFGVEVTGMFDHSARPADDAPAPATVPALAQVIPREMKVRVARDRRGPSAPSRSDLQVHITLGESDLPVGVLNILNRMSESTLVRSLPPQATSKGE